MTSPKTTTTATSTATATWSITTSFTTGSSSNNNSFLLPPISSAWQRLFTISAEQLLLPPPPVQSAQPSNAGSDLLVYAPVLFFGTQFCLRLPAEVSRLFTKRPWRLQDICITTTARRRPTPSESFGARVQNFLTEVFLFLQNSLRFAAAAFFNVR